MSLTGYVSEILITSEGGERGGGGDGEIKWLWLCTIFTSSLEPLVQIKQLLS